MRREPPSPAQSDDDGGGDDDIPTEEESIAQGAEGEDLPLLGLRVHKSFEDESGEMKVFSETVNELWKDTTNGSVLASVLFVDGEVEDMPIARWCARYGTRRRAR